MPRLLLIKYICHSVFGIYSIIIQYEKFMTPVPAYGELQYHIQPVSW